MHSSSERVTHFLINKLLIYPLSFISFIIKYLSYINPTLILHDPTLILHHFKEVIP